VLRHRWQLELIGLVGVGRRVLLLHVHGGAGGRG
jgi:hypothetical protein